MSSTAAPVLPWTRCCTYDGTIHNEVHRHEQRCGGCGAINPYLDLPLQSASRGDPSLHSQVLKEPKKISGAIDLTTDTPPSRVSARTEFSKPPPGLDFPGPTRSENINTYLAAAATRPSDPNNPQRVSYGTAATTYPGNHPLVYAQHETRRPLPAFTTDPDSNPLPPRTRFESYIGNTVEKARQESIQKPVGKTAKAAVVKSANLATSDRISVLTRLVRVFIEEWEDEDLQIMDGSRPRVVFLQSSTIYVRNRSYTDLIDDFVVNDLLKYMEKGQEYYANSSNYKIFLATECSPRKELFELTLQAKECRTTKELLENHFHYANKRDRELIIAVEHRRRKIEVEEPLELPIKQEMQDNIKLEVEPSRNGRERSSALVEAGSKARVKREPTLVEAGSKARVKREPTSTSVRKASFLTEDSQIPSRTQQAQAVIKQEPSKVSATHKRQMSHSSELSTSAANQALDAYFDDPLALIDGKSDIRDSTSLDDGFMNLADSNPNSPSRPSVSPITPPQPQKAETESLFLSKSEELQSSPTAAPVSHGAASNIRGRSRQTTATTAGNAQRTIAAEGERRNNRRSAPRSTIAFVNHDPSTSTRRSKRDIKKRKGESDAKN